MSRRTITTIGLDRLIAAAAVLALLGPAPAQELPDEIHLTGLVRDFHETHADFQERPALGFGHYVGLVGTTLGPGERPAFDGSGNKVLVEAADSSGRFIAPHLVNMMCSSDGPPVPLVADGRVRGRNQSVFDSYDSSLGPYGGTNVGSDATAATNSTDPGMIVLDNSSTLNGDALIGPGGDPAVVADIQGTLTGTVENLPDVIPMPVVTEPVGLPVYPGGDLDVPMNGSMTISSDWQVDEFDIKRNAVVTIDGDVTILCIDRWLINRNAQVIIPDGSSLTIYCRTQARLYGNDTVVNPDTANPSKLRIFILGSDPWNDQFVANGNGTRLCARVVAPTNVLDLDQGAEFFGTFIGAAVEINNQSRFHVDMRDYTGMTSDPTLGDTPATVDPTPATASVTSPASFDEWFQDVPSVNLSTPMPVTLVRQPDDTYLFDDTLDPLYGSRGGFFPVDDILFGNEGASHNSHFTYAIVARFTYDASAGQFFVYTGDSDGWVFIDGELVIDVGGVHSGLDQRIDLDRLCLEDGQTCWLAFYLADRYAPMSSLRIETNIVFTGTLLPSVTAAFD